MRKEFNENEGPVHRRLKKVAASALQDMGYKYEFEYPVVVGNERIIVDVVGFSGSNKVAVECGTFDNNKIQKLLTVFNRVYTLSYMDALLCYERLVRNLELKISKLEKKVPKVRFLIPLTQVDKAIKILPPEFTAGAAALRNRHLSYRADCRPS